MELLQKSKKIPLVLFLITFSIGMLYALYTDHRWEDWYITYRASKNLATGHGLTYTSGERVYSFTSPINTLLPAFFATLFKSRADEYAIWLYRLVNCLVLGSCAVYLYKLSKLLSLNKVFSFLLVGLFSVNILIIDNSINGMEAPYMMLFLILLIYALCKRENVRTKEYLLPFAGLMYTRPDGFVYASFLIAGFLIFYAEGKQLLAQLPLLKKILRASLLALLLYLPWVLFTWYYYGNPIPNTILAKSVFREYQTWALIKEFIKFPFGIFRDTTNYVLSGLFMPGYYFFGGWNHLEVAGRLVTTLAFFSFLLPFLPKAARALSLSVYLIVFYLTIVSGQGGQPWYLPNVSLQVILFFCIVLNFLYEKYSQKIIISIGYAFLSYNILILFLGGYYFKTQQQIVEYGNRKKIGEWLNANARHEKETVFLECLGYIGYFSNLKMYDFPGMSSPEVVAVLKAGKKENKVRYSEVIARLEPDWVVLRPWEITSVNAEIPGLLDNYYVQEKVFSVSDQIPTHWYLMGKPYLENDAAFIVLRKKSLPRQIDHSADLVLRK